MNVLFVRARFHARLYFGALALCSAIVACSSAQTRPARIAFEHFSQAQGLSHYAIQSIVQDRQGFLWIGTQDGLNRYDGYQFRVFRNNPADAASLSDDYVTALSEDQTGAIWVGTMGGGLNRFDPVTQRFDRYRPDSSQANGLSHDVVFTVAAAKDGLVWIGTPAGLDALDPVSRQFVRYDASLAAALRRRTVSALVASRAGLLWIGTDDGLYEADLATGRLLDHYRHIPGDPHSLPENHIHSLHEDPAGRLWIGTLGGGLARLDPGTARFAAYQHDAADPTSLSDDAVSTIFAEDGGTLWVGTFGGGLNRLDVASGRFTRFQHNQNDARSLSHNAVCCVLKDRSQRLWIGTLTGLDSYSALKLQFTYHTSQPGDPNSLSYPWVLSVCEDRTGAIWVGTMGGGLNRFDPQTEQFTHYVHKPQDPNSISPGEIWALTEDRSGTIWVGLAEGGLDRFDPRTGRFTHYRRDGNDRTSLRSSWVHSLLEDRSGQLWIGTLEEGLHRRDPATGEFVQYLREPGDATSLSHNTPWPIFEDHTGTLWIGTMGGGLNRYHPETQAFTHYRHDPADPASLSGNRISAIAEDQDGTLWVGTFGAGLNRFDPATGRAVAYGEDHGLQGHIISGIVPDDRGQLWVSTDNGLYKFDPKTERFLLYDASNGLPSATFHIGAALKTRAGKLIFGGMNGFSIFSADEIHDNRYVPPVVLTDFMVFNKRARLDTAISLIRTISLPHDSNFVSVEFAALDYTDPSKNQYQYKLEHVSDRLEDTDTDWISSGNRRHADFIGLNPGSYLLRIRASNNAGLWNEQGTSLDLVIRPPFWQTFGFQLAVLALVLVAARILYKRRVERLLEMERMRMRIASDLHDDVGANLSSIALKSEMLLAGEQLDEGRQRRIHEIVQTARETALSLREIVWFVNAEYDTLGKLVSKMEDVTATLLDGHATYTFELVQPVPDQRLTMTFRHNVYFLYKEALNNAAKHAHATHVQVRVSVQQGVLTIVVQDDGVGFSEADIKAGNGLRNMRKRSDDVGGRLQIDSRPGAGTAIALAVEIT